MSRRPDIWVEREVCPRVLSLLRGKPRRKEDLVDLLGASKATVQRALSLLREWGLQVQFSRKSGLWYWRGAARTASDVRLSEAVDLGMVSEEWAEMVRCMAEQRKKEKN